jgi:hypothetical protein
MSTPTLSRDSRPIPSLTPVGPADKGGSLCQTRGATTPTEPGQRRGRRRAKSPLASLTLSRPSAPLLGLPTVGPLGCAGVSSDTYGVDEPIAPIDGDMAGDLEQAIADDAMVMVQNLVESGVVALDRILRGTALGTWTAVQLLKEDGFEVTIAN